MRFATQFLFASLCHRRKLIVAILLSVSMQGHASEVDSEMLRENDSDYESMSVVQNRFFKKQHRPNIGIFGGSFLKESYTETSTYGVRLTYFPLEWLAVETQHVRTIVKDTDDRKQLQEMEYRPVDSDKRVHPDPEVNRIHSITDINATFSPFYGKVNLLDMFILYTDLYFTTGVARMETDQGSKPAFTAGIGQRFHFKDSMSFRVDFRSRSFQEERAGKERRKQAMSIDAGLDYFFF